MSVAMLAGGRGADCATYTCSDETFPETKCIHNSSCFRQNEYAFEDCLFAGKMRSLGQSMMPQISAWLYCVFSCCMEKEMMHCPGGLITAPVQVPLAMLATWSDL